MRKHKLYTRKDKNAPGVIKDLNGDIVLSMCKICRKAESELDQPCIMNTTIKQQIEAVQRAYLSSNDIMSAKQSRQTNALNDAASTLAAVNMVGEDKIYALPELINLLTKAHELLPDTTKGISLYNRISDILNKLEKS